MYREYNKEEGGEKHMNRNKSVVIVGGKWSGGGRGRYGDINGHERKFDMMVNTQHSV